MAEEKKDDNKVVWIAGAVLLVICLLIFVPGIIESKKELDTAKLEYNLIKEGKTISASDIAEKFTILLSEKRYNEANTYLSENCKLFDSNNNERVKLEDCLEKLDKYNNHTIEERGNDLKDQETYRILWNGTNYENTNQIITLFLKKKIESDKVTYEIIKIIFTNNTIT